jgi:hypothetical protein
VVKWSGGKETLLFHFTHKVTIVQGVLCTMMRWRQNPRQHKRLAEDVDIIWRTFIEDFRTFCLTAPDISNFPATLADAGF